MLDRDRWTNTGRGSGVRSDRHAAVRDLLSTRSFGLVLLGLFLSYGLTVALAGHKGASLVLVVQMATVLIALRASDAHRIVRGMAGAVIVFSAIAAVVNVFGTGTVPEGLVFSAAALLYLVTPLAIVRAIVRSGRVDREVVLGAIDAYLMIGMFFAFTYQALAVVTGGPFFGSSGEGTTAQDLFFSFTTLTTTGYGNLVPATRLGQTVAVFEMLIGQLFLVTALAKIVSAWRPRRWADRVDAAPEGAPPQVDEEPAPRPSKPSGPAEPRA